MAALNTFIYQNRDEQFFLEHFMPGTAVGDPTIWVKRASEMGEAAMVNLTAVNWDVSYGATALQAIDVFRAKQPRAPIVLYFHGGYWCAYDKANYRYIPGMLVPQGVTTILANYDLCPNVTLDEIVSQTIECIAFVYQHAAELGGDPEQIFLAGSSAGGQLATITGFAVTGFVSKVVFRRAIGSSMRMYSLVGMWRTGSSRWTPVIDTVPLMMSRGKPFVPKS